MAKPGAYHLQGTLVVRECANDTRATTNLSIESLYHVVRTDFLPVFFSEMSVFLLLSFYRFIGGSKKYVHLGDIEI